MSPASFIRRLVRARASNRPTPPPAPFALQLTLLEGRDVPSSVKPVPPQQTPALVGAPEAGVPGDVGKAAKLGDVTATPGATTGGVKNGPSAGRSGDTVTVPFKLTGGGPAPDGLPLFPGGIGEHTSTGTATHLGQHTGSGVFTLGTLAISPTGAVTGTFSGTYTFVAANGDQLVMTYGPGVLTGQLSADGLSVLNVEFDAIFTADPAASTGRFAGATGGFRMLASADSISLVSSVPGYTAPFNYTWVGSGELVLQKGNK